jgi:hypothetical protein
LERERYGVGEIGRKIWRGGIKVEGYGMEGMEGEGYRVGGIEGGYIARGEIKGERYVVGGEK